ncbi:MAG: pilus assembly protein [Paracoccaceae bacterium]
MRTIVNAIRRFGADDSGAVTVDWVALTAAVVVIGIGLTYAVFGTGSDGVAGLVTNLTKELGDASSNISGAVNSATPPGLGGTTTATTE